MNFPARPKTSGRTVWLIITGLLACVLGPILLATWPTERAKWLLAAAANAVEFSKEPNDESIQKARALLAKAKEIDPLIVRNHDYLWIEINSSPSKRDWVVGALSELPVDSRAAAAQYLSAKFLEKGEFELSYEMLKAAMADVKKLSSVQKNEVAYFASLAGVDLDKALLLVEEALAEEPNSGYLDTKAWVLFKAGELDEALKVIEEAERLLASESDSWAPFSTEEVLLKALEEGKPPFVSRDDGKKQPKSSVTVNNRAVARIHATIVYRYHKAEILKALGETDEAEKAFEWLRQRGFDDFEKLY